jgi:hypothetical protein
VGGVREELPLRDKHLSRCWLAHGVRLFAADALPGLRSGSGLATALRALSRPACHQPATPLARCGGAPLCQPAARHTARTACRMRPAQRAPTLTTSVTAETVASTASTASSARAGCATSVEAARPKARFLAVRTTVERHASKSAILAGWTPPATDVHVCNLSR